MKCIYTHRNRCYLYMKIVYKHTEHMCLAQVWSVVGPGPGAVGCWWFVPAHKCLFLQEEGAGDYVLEGQVAVAPGCECVRTRRTL